MVRIKNIDVSIRVSINGKSNDNSESTSDISNEHRSLRDILSHCDRTFRLFLLG